MRARRLTWTLALVASAAAAGCFYPDYAFDLPDDAGQGGAAGGTGGNGGEAGTLGDASGGAGGDAQVDQSVEADAPSEDATPDVSTDQSNDENVDDAPPDAVDENADAGDEDAADATDEPDADDADAGADDADAQDDAALDADVPDVVDAASEPDALGPENCTNHKDDNGDGLVDCQDPQCGAFACVAPAPPPWSGPFALYDGVSSNPLPGCPTNFDGSSAIDASGQLSWQPAQCSTCACSSPSGASCPASNPTFWDNSSSCQSGCFWSSQSPPPPGACLTVSGFDTTNCSSGPASVAVPSPVATGGTCSPSSQSPTLPPFTWGEAARVCAPKATGGGCGANVCAPMPSGQYMPKLCILSQAGAVSCPSGPYTSKHVFYQGALDTRACSGCTCGSPVGVACTGTLSLYKDSNCSSVLASFPVPTACGGFTPGSLQSLKYVAGSATGGACTPSGGQPSGIVAPNQAITVCCLP